MAMNETQTESAESTLIHHIAEVEIRVQDIERAVAFYRDVVGFDVLAQEAERAVLGKEGAGPVVRLVSTGVNAPADKRATGLFHTAFLYPDRGSLGDALARLAEGGFAIGAGDHGVSEALYIDDPDGNGVELYRDRPRSEWPQPEPGERVAMYTAPVDLQGLLEDRSHPDGSPASAPEGTAVGHVHLQTGDLNETIRFYREGLGLDLMQTLMGSAAFFSSQGYHHHVGANIWNSRGGSPSAPNRAGLERVVFAVESDDEVRRAQQRLEAIGYDSSLETGKLTVIGPEGVRLDFVAA